MTAAFRPDPDAACEGCGAAGAFRFDGETLCADCYAGRGSCCSPEFSGRPAARKTEAPQDNPQPASAQDDQRCVRTPT